MRQVFVAVTLLAAAGCGDNRSGHGPSTGRPDAADDPLDAGGEIDGGRDVDGGSEPGAVVVFDNSDGTFVWTPELEYDEGSEYETEGVFLDVTLPADAQPGSMAPSSVLFFREWPSGLGTYGGTWFRSCRHWDICAGAGLAAGEDFILDGIYELDEWDDLTIVPPLDKAAGDTVGPDDRWITPDVGIARAGLHTGHYNSPGMEFADDQVWFTEGTIGVRFDADDGVHYGFIELAWDPTDRFIDALYLPVRWGYQPEPDTPLVIPP